MLWRRRKSAKNSVIKQKAGVRRAPCLEALEPRLYMSGSNAIDTLNFGNVTGNATSESIITVT